MPEAVEAEVPGFGDAEDCDEADPRAEPLLSFKLSDLSHLRYSDFQDFVAYLGASLEAAEEGSLVMVAANQAFTMALPPNWTEQVEEDTMRIYFYNAVTDESRWTHPQDSAFREVVQEVRQWPPEAPAEQVVAAIDTHLRDFREKVVVALEPWSGPYYMTQAAEGGSPELTSEGGQESEYYFNTRTGESCWEHPAKSWEYELYTRYLLLYRCLLARERRGAGPQEGSEAGSSDGEMSDDPDGGVSDGRFFGVTALAHSFLGSLRLQLPQPDISSPPMNRPSGLLDPALSMRSDMSFLTARSDGLESSPRRSPTPTRAATTPPQGSPPLRTISKELTL
mmetsp:Transcript_111647/g.249161  ORF Transcript_111647/g.249161 Transcript_111647/m.249161 type:complete len:337 (-) Transcript_111647:200-1210(-)